MKRMIKELNATIHGGLGKFIANRLLLLYPPMLVFILISYLTNHWLFKEIAIGLLLIPVVTMLIALPMWWLLDIRPITNKTKKDE